TIKTGASEPEKPKFAPMSDPQVQRGFGYLAGIVSGGFGPGAGLATPFQPNQINGIRRDLFFMWSLERTCMVYGQGRVGNVDWHAWGADGLVQTQLKTGAWMGQWGEDVSTAFAVMFLCRANLVRDLTNLLGNRMRARADFTPKASKEVRPGSSQTVNPAPKEMTPEKHAGELTKALVSAAPEKQAELLKQYSNPESSKGSAYTIALANAIPQLSGEMQKLARNALSDRLADTGEN